MKLKIKNLQISSGVTLVAVLNRKDAEKFDLHVMDRIKIKRKNKIETVVIDITRNNHIVSEGTIGVFSEVAKSLDLKGKDIVEIMLARKPLSLDYIKKKLDGGKLTKKEIDQIVWDIVHNKLSAVELTYFVAACYTKVMDPDETILLTKAMVETGDILKINKFPIIDKHCIGGIPGNRTTMVIVPIIAAAGYYIPKTSSRSITSPAGTADTMEVLANVSFPIEKMKEIVLREHGCIVWGGALNLAPADDKIIAVERPLGIDAESQLLASIMAKKHSVSSTHILIDIPIGKTAKIKDRKEAGKLQNEFEEIGKKLGKKVHAIITDGSQPIGNGIGPLMEARDVLWILKRDSRRPLDLEKKCLLMCAKILEMAGERNGHKKAREILESGKAYKKMMQIIAAQKGKNTDPDKMRLAKYSFDFLAGKKGVIKEINNLMITKIARVAGAPIEKSAGLYLYKHVNDKVHKGERLFTIFSENQEKLKFAADIAKESTSYLIK